MAFRFVCLGKRLLPLALILALPFIAKAGNNETAKKKLTERVDQFYQVAVSGEWRKSEAFLTQDSLDMWVAQSKGRIESYQIDSIDVAPDGKKASAKVMVTFRVPMAGNLPFTQPQITDWIQQKGQWFLKLKPAPSRMEAFKNLSSTPSTTPLVQGPSPLRFDEDVIKIPLGDSETAIKIPFQNISPFTITVQNLHTNCPCIRAEMDKTEFQSEEKGVLTVTYSGSSNPGTALAIQAVLGPNNYSLSLPVEFSSEH